MITDACHEEILAKIIAQTRQDTLREVGKWLDKTLVVGDLEAMHTRPSLLALVEGIIDLQRGEMPEQSGT